MKSLLRITRHEVQPHQADALKRIFGDVRIKTLNTTLPTDSRQLTSAFDEVAEEHDIVEVVLPAGMLESILKFTQFAKSGRPIIKAEMVRDVDSHGNVTFTFDHYVQYKKVEVIVERL